MTHATTPDDKQSLRQRLLDQRGMFSELEAHHAAHAITQHLLTLPQLASMRTVAGYCDIRGEIPSRKLLETLHQHGKQLALPITNTSTRTLEFHPWQPNAPLPLGAFNIPQPVPSAAIIPDAMLLPLLACDAHGTRLGYGGGFYDRTLAALHAQGHTPLLIGVGYDFQYVDLLPKQPHDVTVHAMITPSGIHWCDSNHATHGTTV